MPNAFIVPRSARRQKCVNRKPNVRYKRYPIQLRRNVTFSPQLHKRDAAHTSHVFVMLLDLFLEHLIDQRVGTKTILLNHNRSFMCYSPYSKKSRYRRTGTQNATLKLCQVEHFAFSFVFWAGRDCKFRHTFGFFFILGVGQGEKTGSFRYVGNVATLFARRYTTASQQLITGRNGWTPLTIAIDGPGFSTSGGLGWQWPYDWAKGRKKRKMIPRATELGLVGMQMG